jgi:hypothetical protein
MTTRGRFVSLGASFLNLDHVRKFRIAGDEKIEVTWTNGEVETFHDSYKFVTFDDPYFIIPATPGHQLLQYFADDGELRREPVLAWRISEDQTKHHYGDGSLIAISMDSTSAESCSNVFTAVLAPDGVLSTYDGKRFDSVEQWQEHARQHYAETEKKRQEAMARSRAKLANRKLETGTA